MNDKLVALVNCANSHEAERIARALVTERLAACVNVHQAPVRSVYRWKGKLQSAREVPLVIKTSRRLFGRLERRVRQLHSYQLPEIIALPITAGSEAYLDWLEESLKPSRPKRRLE